MSALIRQPVELSHKAWHWSTSDWVVNSVQAPALIAVAVAAAVVVAADGGPALELLENMMYNMRFAWGVEYVAYSLPGQPLSPLKTYEQTTTHAFEMEITY